jgi:hypothetical protein
LVIGAAAAAVAVAAAVLSAAAVVAVKQKAANAAKGWSKVAAVKDRRHYKTW